MTDKFQQALALHQGGQLAQAQAMYEEVLRAEPRHFDALHLSGVLAGQTRDLPKALELIGKAIDIEPTNAAAHFNRAFALNQLNRRDAALDGYDRAIALRPGYADAHHKRGELLRELGRFDAAIESYDRAIVIKPHFLAAHISRGVALEDLRRWDEAVASYDRAIAIQGQCTAAYLGRGSALNQLGQREAALNSYDRALAIDPDCHPAHIGRGLVLERLGKWHLAIASYDRAIEIKPDFAAAYVNRGVVLEALRRWEEALASYDQAIALKVDYAEAYSNRGNVLVELGRLRDALASYDRAVAIAHDFAEAYSNRGNVLKYLKRLDDALVSFERAIAIKPDYPQAHENKAYALLLAGDFEQGWRCHEWRRMRWIGDNSRSQVTPHNGERAKFEQRLWLGAESLAGRTVLLYSEQGLGDTIQFSRYASLVAKLGATVILEVQKPLMALMSRLEGVSEVVDRESRVPEFDFQCPLMSLPLAFKTTLSTIPGQVPYLSSTPKKLLHWKEKLGAPNKLRVGLVWSGGFRRKESEFWSASLRRNIALSKLAPLKHPDIEFYSLQKGQPAESELAQLKADNWQGPGLVDFTALLSDFSDTAALIENLDLVISVDTSTAHLAGALGKPIWLLNRFDTCWRWMLDRTDSPWYPTLRLYRQETPGDWEGVVQRIRADLTQWMV
jgi:tetratricopeptide (TPR) repeat protein